MQSNSIKAALDAMRRGIPVVVLDDEDRENEGDLILAAEHATPQNVAFMLRWTSGILCVAIDEARTQMLQLPNMVAQNTDPRRTAFTVSVDVSAGMTTGISATERAATIRALADPAARAEDFVRPGHVFPLRAVPGGVLERAGHTEAALDLARLAGLSPAGLLGEVTNDDGSVARRPELEVFAREHGLPLVTIQDLIAYRRCTERLVARRSSARLPTRWGEFSVHGYVDLVTGLEHLAITMGEPGRQEAALVRVHSECLTGEALGSLRCDCKPQLDMALARIAAEGSGVLVYLRGHEGRGIGLIHKLRAYALQDKGSDTAEANQRLGLPVDSRDYSVGAQILLDLGVHRIRLMTNNPRKYDGLHAFGLAIVERLPLVAEAHPESAAYLRAKRDLLGHLLSAEEIAP
jgi:3,4-dihydroxy 2-butanone 4-phosphate synthase/GTP cyclohydrolase II